MKKVFKVFFDTTTGFVHPDLQRRSVGDSGAPPSQGDRGLEAFTRNPLLHFVEACQALQGVVNNSALAELEKRYPPVNRFPGA